MVSAVVVSADVVILMLGVIAAVTAVLIVSSAVLATILRARIPQDLPSGPPRE
jgi:3-hydroxyisobutyrate dehydrogenase-like beta-hydroxyacid dehydrogenase